VEGVGRPVIGPTELAGHQTTQQHDVWFSYSKSILSDGRAEGGPHGSSCLKSPMFETWIPAGEVAAAPHYRG
jgi:hypothetical protein